MLTLSLLTPAIAISAVVYLKDGGQVECESFWKDKDGVHAKISDGMTVELQTNEVDMKKTFNKKPKKVTTGKKDVLDSNNNSKPSIESIVSLFNRKWSECDNALNKDNCQSEVTRVIGKMYRANGYSVDEFKEGITRSYDGMIPNNIPTQIDIKQEVWQQCKRGYLNKLENPSSAIFEDDPMRMETIKPNGSFYITSTIYAKSGGMLRKHIGACEGNTSDYSSLSVRIHESN